MAAPKFLARREKGFQVPAPLRGISNNTSTLREFRTNIRQFASICRVKSC